MHTQSLQVMDILRCKNGLKIMENAFLKIISLMPKPRSLLEKHCSQKEMLRFIFRTIQAL